ncbi:MAG TPA: outer membrane beta-barrel protein [Terriglobales bacterium]|nr:outer membrane beta-barrel protein [Terriglobales bacterium]
MIQESAKEKSGSTQKDEKRRVNLWFFAVPVVLASLALSNDAQGQGTGKEPQFSKVDLFVGYSYIRASTLFTGERINLHGASFSGDFYVNHWLGIVGDVGSYHAGNIANQFDLTLWSYQGGLRVRLRNDTHFTPYGQFLIGGGHAGGTLYTSSLGPGLAPIGTNNSFLYTVGGGVDYRLSDKIGIRILQAEYLRSEFLNGSIVGHQQNNLRLSAGVVFNFGRD